MRDSWLYTSSITVWRNRRHTVLCVLGIALGVAFSLLSLAAVDQVLFRPLPFHEPQELVLLQERNARDHRRSGSVAESVAAALGEKSQSLESVAAFGFGGERRIVWIDGAPELVRALDVTPNMFHVLGAGATAGGLARLAPTVPLSSVVISQRLASRIGGHRDGMIDAPVSLDAGAYRVAGVLPRAFVFPPYIAERDPDMYTFFRLRHGAVQGARVLALARLRQGVRLAEARAEVEAVSRGVYAGLYGDNNTEVWLADLREEILGRSRPAAWQIAVGAGLFSVVAWINTAKLLLSSFWARRRETAMRVSLGAGTPALVAAAIGEIGWIVVGGSALGAAGGALLVAAISPELPLAIAPLNRPTLDLRAIVPGSAMAIISTCGLALVIVPLLRRVNIRDLFSQSGGGSNPRPGVSLQALMVAAEVASATLLVTLALASAGQLWLEFSSPLGLVPGAVLVARPVFPPGSYDDPGNRHRFVEALAREIDSRAGVEAVGTVDVEPLSGARNSMPYVPYGREPRAVDVETRAVGSDYFGTLGIPVVRGGPFANRGGSADDRSAILSERAARLLFGTLDGIVGMALLTESGTRLDVVGVVGDVRDTREVAPTPIVYRIAHAPLLVARSLVIKSTGKASAVRSTVREAGITIDPHIPLELTTLQDVRADLTALARFTFWLSGLSATAVTIQVLLGILGLCRHLAESRQLEAAVRMALGETAASVRWRIVRSSVQVMLVGVACGAFAAVTAVRWGATVLGAQNFPVLVVTLGAGICLVLGIAASHVAVKYAVPDSIWRLLQS